MGTARSLMIPGIRIKDVSKKYWKTSNESSYFPITFGLLSLKRLMLEWFDVTIYLDCLLVLRGICVNVEKKKSKFKPFLLIIVGVIVVLFVIGTLSDDSTSNSDNKTAASGTNASKSKDHEAKYAEAQDLFKNGNYVQANAVVDDAIKAEPKEEYTKLKADIEAKIKKRKTELEANFEIKEDKVENITFISPSSGVTKGLVFYPYIGIKDSNKYMILRVGFQEDASKALFVFTSVKVRAGEQLQELKFNPMNKLNDVDLFGSGMTELVDIDVDKKIEDLISNVIPANDETIVRFEDISNKATDYTLTEKQKKAIADIVEYYNYLD